MIELTREMIDKIMKELQEDEEKRKQFVAEQIRKGCDKCSQWDDYWGCDKCARI